MTIPMVIERLQDLSVFYKVKDILSPHIIIKVVDEFPTDEFKKDDLPLVSVEGLIFTSDDFEMGNRRLKNDRKWMINIFGKNKAQRSDIMYFLNTELQQGIPVLDYNEGFPENGVTDQTQLGTLVILGVTTEPIPVFSALVTTLYWRGELKIITEYSEAPE